MVNAAPEDVRRDAEQYFKAPQLPETFAFTNDLSPLHQRLFVRDLWEALARAAIDPTEESLAELVDLVEAWEATAELDASPELLARIRAPKRYREVPV
jgi:hypothetical protein